MKKDGKITLYPKLNSQDQFLTKIYAEKVVNFRVRIKSIYSAILSIKMSLKHFEEVNEKVKIEDDQLKLSDLNSDA